jgi:hypothetical protein
MLKHKTIRHVAWRNGRPRFQPGPELRLTGHKGKDLRHEDGRWFNWEEAEAWSDEFRTTVLGKAPRPEKTLGPLTGPYERGFIYFLWAGQRIKVGFSSDPAKRVGSLKTGIGDPIRLFLALPGTMGDEKRLHRRLASQRVTGEWFKASTATLRVMRMALNEADGIRDDPY